MSGHYPCSALLLRFRCEMMISNTNEEENTCLPPSRQKREKSRAVLHKEFLISYGTAGGVSRLRARPRGAAPWIPAAFEKAGETFNMRFALL